MTQFFIYIFEVSICFSLFYLIYVLLVRGETFHNLKRFYLLLTVIVSIIIPQLPSGKITREIEKTIVAKNSTQADFSIYRDTFEKVVFGNIPDEFRVDEYKQQPFNILNILIVVYAIGVGIFLFRLLSNLYQVSQLLRKFSRYSYGNNTIIILPDNYSTFSFFNYIFLNDSNLSAEERYDVLFHEETHIRQRHSIDILFIEICKIIFWFNPVIWFYKKSLVVVHECLADKSLVDIKTNNIEAYQSLLLKQYLSKINIELAHPFNYSLIKLRIKMMTKTKSKWWAKYKLIFALPVIVVGLIAFTNADLNSLKEGASNSNNSEDYFEPNPYGMVYIPQGSFTLKRTDGEITKEFEVTVDPFWMKETELRVEEYFDYLESLKKDSTIGVYEAALPDIGKAPFKDYYVNDTYKKYPMVGVSLVQAQNFCKWMTKKENQKLESEGKHPVADYRIPMEVEWIYASFGGLNPDEIVKPTISGLTEIKRGREIKKVINEFGLIHMFTNVSEWTNTSFEPEVYMNELKNSSDNNMNEIIVRGDNYKKELISDKLILNGNDSYDYVGFRYVRSYLGKP